MDLFLPRRARGAALLFVHALVTAACSGDLGTGPSGPRGVGPRDPDPPDPPVSTEAPPAAMRLLSRFELERTYESLLGAPLGAAGSLPMDQQTHAFDRVVQSQTITRNHLAAYETMAHGATEQLLGGRIAALVPACPASIMPPSAASAISRHPGGSLSLDPDWSVHVTDTGRTYMQYPETASIVLNQSFPSAGRYRLSLTLETPEHASAAVTYDGAPVGSWPDIASTGPRTFTLDIDASEGTGRLEIVISDVGGAPMYVDGATVEGPIDPGAGRFDAERRACADAIVAELAPRAWRRPLTDEERARLTGAYESGAAQGFRAGLDTLLASVLLSPHFLYLVERGEAVAAADEDRPLTPFEMASRLSYTFCEAPPDDELRALAVAGGLRTADEVMVQAARLLESPCGHRTVRRFFSQWLELDRLPSIARDPETFPEFSSGLSTAMLEEAETYFDTMVLTESASLEELYLGRRTWPSAALQPVYGPMAGTGALELPEERAGFLTLPGVLAVTAEWRATSPVRRGAYVLRRLLCTELASPPQDLDIQPPPFDPTLTTRDRWARHSSDPVCAGCHLSMDPVGFALEDFDALGRYRTMENGQPIDASGGVPTLGLADGSLRGGRELAEAIAGTDEAASCFTSTWFRFAMARLEEDEDAATLAELTSMIHPGDASVRDLMIATAGAHAFRHRVIGGEE